MRSVLARKMAEAVEIPYQGYSEVTAIYDEIPRCYRL